MNLKNHCRIVSNIARMISAKASNIFVQRYKQKRDFFYPKSVNKSCAIATSKTAGLLTAVLYPSEICNCV